MTEQSQPTSLTIPARDGYPLAATLYNGTSDRLVVISSATAVPRGFYKHFANALAAEGFAVLTYDYRGIGESRPPQLRGFRARMRDWAMLDMSGILDWVAEELSPSRTFLIGHSVGGQVAGLMDNADRVDGMITYSSQSGHWRLQGGEQKAAVAFHMMLTFPLLANTVGYLPWKKLGGSAEDLPKGVALEWAKWCRHRLYLLGDKSLPLERYNHFRAPVLAYSVHDDKWGTKKSVDAMMSAYPNLERRHLKPQELGLKKLGHFGFFRPSSEPLWREPIQWLHARS